MAGTVGSTTLRTDIEQQVLDRTPKPIECEHVEAAELVRMDDIARPFVRARTTDVKDLQAFYKLFSDVLEAARDYDGREYQIRFTKEFPSIDTELPTFSVNLVSRRPFVINGRKELSFREMGSEPDPDYPGNIIHTEMRRQENVIRLTVWARTNKAADELAEWVEEKFFEYLWVFQWAGLAHPVTWLGRGEDIYLVEREQQIYGVPMTFQVITAKIVHRRSTALRKLAVKLGIVQEG